MAKAAHVDPAGIEAAVKQLREWAAWTADTFTDIVHVPKGENFTIEPGDECVGFIAVIRKRDRHKVDQH